MGSKESTEPEVIRVKNLGKDFTIRKRQAGFLGSIKSIVQVRKETLHAVDDVNFSIRRGELVGYLGPNGAGKSTTIKMLTGILQPTHGEILINGVNPSRDRRTLTRQIGVVFGQKTQLWWDLPVEESFDLIRTIYKIPRDKFKKRMAFFDDLLRLGDFKKQQTRKLSLGQRMRGDLAASLLHNPPVLFLDEPTIGLDILTQEAIRDFIKELNRTEKTTIILTTHDMIDVELLADRLILLDKGKIQYDGKLEDFSKQYSQEKLVSIHLEAPIGESVFTEASIRLHKKHSSSHFEAYLSVEESLAPLIESLSSRGARIQEISVRKQELGDTLKQMYKGNHNLEL